MTNIAEEIKTAVLEGEDDLAQSLTRQSMNDGLPPIEVVNRGLCPGLRLPVNSGNRTNTSIPI